LRKGALLMSNETNNNPCYSFAEGHHFHYIAINRASKPRVPAQVRVLGEAFQVTVEGETSFWFTHNPQRLLIALAGAKPENIEATQGRTWLFVTGDYSTDCFNMTNEVLTPCVRELKQPDPEEINRIMAERPPLVIGKRNEN